MTSVFSGSVGIEFTASGDHEQQLDTARPVLGWWVYLKEDIVAPKSVSEKPMIGTEEMVPSVDMKWMMRWPLRKDVPDLRCGRRWLWRVDR